MLKTDTTMQEFVVNTIQLGEEQEAEFLWVSLHFESPASVDDRIHIVSATSVDEQDRRSGMDKIYLERLDQIQAAYGAASSILVTADAIKFDFTADGQRQLGFSSTLRLLWSSSLDGYEEARETFTKMQNSECDEAIKFA